MTLRLKILQGTWYRDYELMDPKELAKRPHIAESFISFYPLRYIEFSKFPLTIGRQETNMIVLDDPNVSRIHARIIEKKTNGNEYYIQDLGSSKGIKVLSKKPQPKQEDELIRIGPGDKIILGATILEVLPSE
ncbi:FHA domain-containing protein [Candidatus Woesearchaeota archaeon]|nr:FHA domain-containing protein [Candidatus Woesearchaeota archaeon]